MELRRRKNSRKELLKLRNSLSNMDYVKIRRAHNRRISQENIENDPCPIETLSAELLTNIFELCDIRTRLRAEAVSKRWQTLLKEESWRHFTQCRLDGTKMCSNKYFILFKRCGQKLRVLIVAPKSAEGQTNQPSIQPLFDWIHLLPKLDSLCAHRQLREDDLEKFTLLTQLRCLCLDGCMDRLQRPEFFQAFIALFRQASFLRYLSLTKARNNIEIRSFLNPPISGQLRYLRLDDSFAIEWVVQNIAKSAPQLLGFSMMFQRQVTILQAQIILNPENEHIFCKLEQFEMNTPMICF